MSQKRPTPPKPWEIYKAWAEIDFKGLEEKELQDCGEFPNCFACGFEFRIKKEYVNSSCENKWNNAYGIEKAHIIPYSLGGYNTPLNYLLLCSKCHVEAPDIKDRRIILNWCNNHEFWINSTLINIIEITKQSIYDPKTEEESEWVNHILESYRKGTLLGKELQKWFKDNVTTHFGVGMKTSTFVEGVYKYAHDTFGVQKALKEVVA